MPDQCHHPGTLPSTRCTPAHLQGQAGDHRRYERQRRAQRNRRVKDVIVGLGGNDKLSGLAGNDMICGGSGKDTLLGQKGKDALKGGGGRDLCKGGKGKDTASKCEVEKSI